MKYQFGYIKISLILEISDIFQQITGERARANFAFVNSVKAKHIYLNSLKFFEIENFRQ